MPKYDYDPFRRMMNEISRFKDQYTSFTTNKVYTDLLGKTASGLLKDVAASTSKLSYKEREHHEYSLEVFAAFCMYFCVTKLRESNFRNMDPDRIQDTVSTVYDRMLKRIKNDLQNGGECHFVRNLIKGSAVNAMIDIYRKEGRYVPLPEPGDDFSGSDLERLLAGGMETIRRVERLDALEMALAEAAHEGIISRDELASICHFYGFGDGFKRLSNMEIAAKLGISEGRASTMRKDAINRLRDFIMDTPDLRDLFFA